MRIGILGGTGPAGRSLAARLASIGYDGGDRFALEVPGDGGPRRARREVAGARRAARVRRQRRRPPSATWSSSPRRGTRRRRPPRSTQRRLRGKVVVSMANALVRVGHEFQPLVPPRGSVAAHVQAAVPSCRVVAAFHHLPAKELGNLGEPIDSDVLICGDDADAVSDGQRDRRQDPRLPPARRRRAVERHRHRGVHRRAAAAQRALQDTGRAEADGNQTRPSSG